MRVRVFRAFASNNSGSYTLVGRFLPEVAGEVARALAEVCARHGAWLESPDGDFSASPLAAFARAEGLKRVPEASDEEWPLYGTPPEVVHLDRQVIVHVGYTVSMPALFGEFFYARGGRVELELNHTHDPLAVELGFWAPGLRYDDPAIPPRLAALRGRIEAALPELLKRPDHDTSPPVAPAWHRGPAMGLSVVFPDLAGGVLAVRKLCAEAGVAARARIFEVSPDDPDPFASLRLPGPHRAGRYRVALWGSGPDRVRVMRALREALGCTLDEARGRLDDLPNEVLVDVDPTVAQSVADRLREAGADAEAFVPIARPPR